MGPQPGWGGDGELGGDRNPKREQRSPRGGIQPCLGAEGSGQEPAWTGKPGTGMDAAKWVTETWNTRRTWPRPPTLFLLLSQPCRLARIWLSMAWTQSSRSSDVEASKSHVWPVRDTMMNSNGSSGSGRERCPWHRSGKERAAAFVGCPHRAVPGGTAVTTGRPWPAASSGVGQAEPAGRTQSSAQP